MASIALVNIGMHGHVNPTLGFTRELVRRGHGIHFFSTPEFDHQIRATGAQFVPYSSSLGRLTAEHAKVQAEATEKGVAPPVQVSAMTRFLKEFEDTFTELFHAIEALSPDLMVYDFASFAPKLIADHFGIKTIKFFTTYASNAHYSLVRETFAKHDYPSMDQIVAAQAMMQRLGSRHGVQVPPLAQAMESIEAENLVFLPQSFQPFGDTFDRRFAFVGPCLRETDPQLARSLIPAGEGPIMIVSLGSLFHEWPEFYQAVIDAFGDSPWRVVMAIGSSLDLAALGPLPQNFKVMRHIPQVELLQYADLFISHGGMNSTMESLYFGVPMVVIPQIEEQELTARRVGEMGLGTYLPRSLVTTNVLRDTVLELFADPQVSKKVQAMREHILQSGGSSKAADIIEGLLPVNMAPSNPLSADAGYSEVDSEKAGGSHEHV